MNNATIIKRKYDRELDTIRENDNLLNAWEMDFIDRIQDFGLITDRQAETIEKIYKKVNSKRR